MKKQKKERRPAARVCGPRRGVPLMMTANVEDAVPATHPIRGVWDVVSALDWSGLSFAASRAGFAGGSSGAGSAVIGDAVGLGDVGGDCLGAGAGAALRHGFRLPLGAGRGDGESSHAVGLFAAGLRDAGRAAFADGRRLASERGGVVDTLLVDGTKVKARAGADSFENAEALEEMASRWLSRIRGVSARRRSRARRGRGRSASAWSVGRRR